MTGPTDTTDRPVPVPVEMLHAFVDGQLSAADRNRVEAWLNKNPEAAQEIAGWAEQNAAIETLFPIDVAPELPQITAPANIAAAPTGLRPALIAAALALFAVGLAGGWALRDRQAGAQTTLTASLVGEAIAAHAVFAADQNRPVEIAATEEALLLRWLSNRLGHTLTAPDLSANGYELVGGRLLSASEGPAAQFMYEDVNGTRITLFAVRNDPPGNALQPGERMAEFSYSSDGPSHSFYWQDENLSYALVGDVERDTLSRLAIVVFNQLSTG